MITVEKGKKKGVYSHDFLLNEMRKGTIPCKIYLINGFQIQGTIFAYDKYSIIIQSKDQNNQPNQQLIYKHGISTIIPKRNIEY